MFRKIRKINLIFDTNFPESKTKDTIIVAKFNLTLSNGTDIDNYSGYAKFRYILRGEQYKILEWEDLK